MTLTRTPPIILGWSAVAAEAERLRNEGVDAITAWETAAGVAPEGSEHIRLASRAKVTNRTRIATLVQDGAVWVSKDIALALDIEHHRASALCRAMHSAGELELVGKDTRTGGHPAHMYRRVGP
jgi:hypothetical protein